MINMQGGKIDVNFVKAVLTVTGKGDMNLDGALTSADVVLLMNCVFAGIGPPSGVLSCDLNCDGLATSLDVVLLLNAVFWGDPFPC